MPWRENTKYEKKQKNIKFEKKKPRKNQNIGKK